MILGIDLGNNYGRIAKYKINGFPSGLNMVFHPFENAIPVTSISSKVYFLDTESIYKPIVGRAAIQRGITNPNLYFESFKQGLEDNAVIERDAGFKITPIELSTIVLKKMLEAVDSEEGPNTFVPKHIVMSIPAAYNESQIYHTMESIKQALSNQYGGRRGYNENIFFRLISEPVAVTLDLLYKYPQDCDQSKIIVFDLGSSHLDISIVEVNSAIDMECITTKILANNSYNIGGDIFDDLLQTYVLKKNGYKKSELALREEALFIERCRELKCALTSTDSNDIYVPYIDGQSHLVDVVTRKEFEQCLSGEINNGKNYLSLIDNMIQSTLTSTNISQNEIAACILCGGSSCIPIIYDLLSNYFSEKIVLTGGDSVARGAALLGAYEFERASFYARLKSNRW